VSALLHDRDVVAREQNVGCSLLLAIIALVLTAALIDAVTHVAQEPPAL